MRDEAKTESNDARPDSHVLTVGVRTSQAKCFMMMRRRLSLAKITAARA